MLKSRLIAFALVPVLALAACNEEDGTSVSRNAAGFGTGVPAYDLMHDETYDFSWREGLDDLDEDSEVLGRGVWQEPDGDIVTCTSWHGDRCVATRESDDTLDMLEDMGLIGAGAAVGYGASKMTKRPKAVLSQPAVVRPAAPTARKPAPSRTVQPSSSRPAASTQSPWRKPTPSAKTRSNRTTGWSSTTRKSPSRRRR